MTVLVVNLGLPKTGTTTLARALRRAGLKVADHRIRSRQTDDTGLQGAYVADLLYRGYFDTGDPVAHLGGFGAISEMSLVVRGRSLWPQTDFGLIDALRTRHPQIRFLASSRDPFALSQSMLAWSDLGTARLPAADVPGLPAGYGDTTAQRIAWIKGHYAHLRAIFAGDASFLEYDIADPGAPDRIADFLGRPLPWWGRANRNPTYEPA